MPVSLRSELNLLVHNIALYNSQPDYKKLFKTLYPSLKRFADCLLKSNDLAEDVASDTMIILWKERRELIAIENIQVYAFIIAKNLSLNILKRNARNEFIDIEDINIDISFNAPTAEQILINKELKTKMQYAVQSLPARCKLVFKLVKEEGMSYKGTAEVLNISEKTVDAHLVAAVKKLSIFLKQEYNLAH